MRVIELRRPLMDRTSSESSNGSQSVTPIWRKNPFALSERAEESRELMTIYDDDHLTVCPTESIALDYTPKSRPTPIYQDKQHEEYWTFLKSVPDIHLTSRPTPSRCPSLVSGSALSSRNSSTRSTRSSVLESIEDGTSNVRGVCLNSECNGLCFEGINSHTRITHFAEQRLELCPVKSCERHLKGFTRPGDKRRHAFTHFRGSLVCGFCESDSTSFSQASDRVSLFLTHLVKNHGVKAQHPDQEFDAGNMNKSRRKSSHGEPVSTCSVCLEPFTAQILYEHLPGCVLRQIARNEEPEVQDSLVVSSHESSTKDKHSSDFNSLLSSISTEEYITVTHENAKEELTKAPIQSVEPECQDIADITASSRCLSLTSSKIVESSEEETDWTEDVPSRESSPGISQVSRRLSPTKRKIVETIMQQFQHLFQEILRTHTAGSSSSGSSYNGSGACSSNASIYSSASFVSRKRSLSGGSSLPPNDDDDSNKRRRPDSKTDRKQNTSELRFACPYYKRNPGRHPTFTSCRDPGFTTIARLKEHLYRRHLLPPQCHRCCTTFANDVALREHQRDIRGCEVQESIPLEGFDKDQERRLKSKKRSQTFQSEEEKWKGVYQILFPDDSEADMPSPYIEYQPCTGDATEPSNIVQFQEFSRLELPRLVRRTLETVVEQEAQPLEDKLKERLVDIVKECQTQLVALFQATAGPAPTRSTPPQDTKQQVNIPTSTALEAFPNFDSLPVRTLSSSDALSYASHNTPPNPALHYPHPTPPPESHSNSHSPDSGYNSMYSSSSSMATAIASRTAVFSPRTHLPAIHDVPFSPTFNNAQALTNNEYVDLDGYYGLFENRSSGIDQDMLLPTAMTADALATWAFVNPAIAMGNITASASAAATTLDMTVLEGSVLDEGRGAWLV